MTVATMNAVLRDEAWRKDFSARFWSKVDRSGGPDACWLWTAKARHVFGYGVINSANRCGTVNAHVAAWALTNGEIPKGAFILHKCDVPACCNPRHLFSGDAQENIRDKVRKGRQSRVVHTPESRAKIRAGRAANPPVVTPEGAASRSEALKRRWQNPEWRKRFSSLMFGRRAWARKRANRTETAIDG